MIKNILENLSCPLPLSNYPQIVLAHGGGGKLSQTLIEQIFKKNFSNELLDELHDGAMFEIENSRLAFSTDSYVVSPIIFPGGNIGELAVNGTVNDIAMCGAKPLYLSASFIIEEGMDTQELNAIVISMNIAAQNAGVKIVTGDTKVVPRGKADKLFITTSGIGLIPSGRNIHPTQAQVGDKIILSGTIADHGMAIMSVREGLEFESEICSDTTALNGLVETMFSASSKIRILRDPT